jgi:hypothetical protein
MPNSQPRLTGDALQEAVFEAARCRAGRRHRLDPIPLPVGAPRPSFGSFLAERCELCGTVRYAHVSRITGQLLGAYRYDHPSWYEDALGERQDPDWWRATYWSTLDPSLFVDAQSAAKVTDIKKQRRRKAS